MIDPIFQTTNYQLAIKLLDAAVLRQEAIASNIANAETPGYRRVDVSTDFAAQLKSCMASGAKKADLTSLHPQLAPDIAARTTRPDGNNVELDRELLAMNRNSVEHEFLTDIVSGNLRKLRLAITGRSV